MGNKNYDWKITVAKFVKAFILAGLPAGIAALQEAITPETATAIALFTATLTAIHNFIKQNW